jgi:hypothetical protein
MVAPNVKMYTNSGTEGVPSWSEVTASQQVIFCGSGGDPAMTSPPAKEVPAAGTELYDEMWKGSSGSWARVNTYYNDMTLNDNQNVLRFTWDAAFASAPALCVFDNASRVATSQMLAGTAGDTNSTSYVKACLTNAGIAANWCIATTENGVKQTTFNQGQAMQGLSHYIGLDNATWNAASSVTFALAPWIGANYIPDGTKSTLLTLKYQWS